VSERGAVAAKRRTRPERFGDGAIPGQALKFKHAGTAVMTRGRLTVGQACSLKTSQWPTVRHVVFEGRMKRARRHLYRRVLESKPLLICVGIGGHERSGCDRCGDRAKGTSGWAGQIALGAFRPRPADVNSIPPTMNSGSRTGATRISMTCCSSARV
jgi:hypothetical protein